MPLIWVAQPTWLCRAATGRTERQGRVSAPNGGYVVAIPSGWEPDGTGQWPVPPISATAWFRLNASCRLEIGDTAGLENRRYHEKTRPPD